MATRVSGVICGAIGGFALVMAWQMCAWGVFALTVETLDAQGSPVFFLMAAAIFFGPFAAICGAVVGLLAVTSTIHVVVRAALATAAVAAVASLWWVGESGTLVVIEPHRGSFWRTVGPATRDRAMLFALYRTVPYVASAAAVVGAVGAWIIVRFRRVARA